MTRKQTSYEEERETERYPRYSYRDDEEDEAAQRAAIGNQSPVLRDLVEQMHAAPRRSSIWDAAAADICSPSRSTTSGCTA